MKVSSWRKDFLNSLPKTKIMRELKDIAEIFEDKKGAFS